MRGGMPKSSPAILLLVLTLAGAGAGVWLATKPVNQSPLPAGPLPAIAQNSPAEDLPAQIRLLEGQIEYLQGQNAALEEENEQLRRRIAEAGGKGMPKMDAATGGTTPDFEGLTLDLMRHRQLKALPLPTTPATLRDVEDRILAWLRARQPGDEALRFALALTALGWIEQPVDPLPLRAALLARQLGGWFDTRTGLLHLVEADPASGQPAPDHPLAIAFGQVLREYGATLFPPGRPLSTDALLARESLLAGDAGLTRFLLSLQNTAAQAPPSIPGEDPDHPLNQVPMPVFLKELAFFPFHRGFEFAQSLHSADGFPQLDAAYSRPPASSAEIIQPALYLESPPVSADAAPASARPAAPELEGSAPYWDDSLGRFAAFTALRAHNSDDTAGAAAKGLVSDRLLAYAAPEHPRDHAVWHTTLTDPAAADAFFKAMRAALISRYDVKAATDAPEKLILHDRNRRIHLSRAGAQVLLVDAAGENAARALQAAFPAPKEGAP
mgnify:CR=1 FL=1